MIDLSKYKNIHCIGIGGIGLSAIAEILISQGYNVSGSDMEETGITENLKKRGVKVYKGHVASNVDNADLVVYSAAIAENNPERVRAEELGIKQAGRAEILGVLMDQFKTGIAISGTHGKTTTTSMIALILEKAGLDPTILVGGNLDEIGGNVKVGKKDYFVTEACEYRDSFLNLRPDIEVILNIDSDHLDYFRDINHIISSFRKFTEKLRKGGKVIAYDANPFVSDAIKNFEGAITFGYDRTSDYSVKDVDFENDGMPEFNILHKGIDQGRVSMKVPGEHNILNAIAAFACARELGVPGDVIIDSLEKYKGTGRRFDIIGRIEKDVMLVDDYAHHPTEIKATLEAASKVPHNRLWCLFQPHTFTRTLALFDEFKNAFDKADILVITDIYAAREKDIYSITSEKLVENIKSVHKDKEIKYISKFEDIADFVIQNAEEGDLVITMGAGDIYRVCGLIRDREGI